jgi:hypothetical protein
LLCSDTVDHHASTFGTSNEASYNTPMADTAANFFALLLQGFFLGVRHATDADHIVAIATIVSRQRTMHGSMQIGAPWGVGHTITVMTVGSAIVLFGVVIPPRGPGGIVHGHGCYVHRHPNGRPGRPRSCL